jgi:hypothetical protein
MTVFRVALFLIGISSLLMEQVMAKSLEKAIFNIDNVKEIEAPFSEGILFKPMLHPNRQDGSALDLKKGLPNIHHSTAQFTINLDMDGQSLYLRLLKSITSQKVRVRFRLVVKCTL